MIIIQTTLKVSHSKNYYPEYHFHKLMLKCIMAKMINNEISVIIKDLFPFVRIAILRSF